MKKLLCSLALLLWAAFPDPVAAQNSLAGKWQGWMEAAPGKTIGIQFDIAAAGGGFTVLVTSPDSGVRNVPATNVKYADNKLSFDVPKLSGGYAGTLRNGELQGNWSQEGSKLPLTLRPESKPTLTQKEIDALRGDWSGTLTANGLTVTVVLHITAGSGAEPLRATMDVPEQGVKDWEAKNVMLENGHFSVEIPGAMAKIRGSLESDQIVGQWEQMGNTPSLTLKKGKYAPPVRNLALSAAARDKLEGRWSGPLGPLTVIVRFETDAQGRTRGFFDSPNQNLGNIPISNAKLDGTKLTFNIDGFGGKYTGDLAGDTLTGEWIQLGMQAAVPLALTRGK